MTRANDLDANATTTYTYDSGGNITTVKTYAYTTGTLGTVLSTINYTYPTNGWNDRLDTYNGAKINYDAIGNPTTYRDNMSFTWELGRRLKTFSAPSMNASYTYNDAGIRTSKTVNGTTTRYVVSGSQILRLTQGQNTMDFYYDEAGQVYGLSFNGTRYYYLRNGQGDIVGIANTSGAQVVAYSYDTWGKLLSKTSGSILADLNPFRYRAYCYDEESGLFYLNSRYYDPVTGRFINADGQMPGVGGLICSYNLFSYCVNNPVNKYDTSGKKPGDLFNRIEDAARDAALYMFDLGTFDNTWEYATSIYQVSVTETRYRLIPVYTPFLNFSLSKGFFIDFEITGYKLQSYKVTVTKYTYKTVRTQKQPTSVRVPSAPLLTTRVATIHTHPYNEGYAHWAFSSTDKENAASRGVPNFVYTAGGIIRRYDPSDGSDIVIFNDLPKDPHLS